MPKKFSKLKIFLALIPLLLFAVFCVYIFIEPYWIQVVNTKIVDQDIPPTFSGTKIIFISDTHCGLFFAPQRLKNIVARVNQMNPDIIILGGDFVGNYLFENPKYIEPCFAELKNLKAKITKIGVLGNHDIWTDREATVESMREAGITLLSNQAEWIYKDGERIKIGGVKDTFEDRQDLDPTIFDARNENFTLLVSHNPDFVEEIKTNLVDFVLSGHTHGGQMTFFGLWAPATSSLYGQKYRTGIVETPYTKVLVSNGVGAILPIRFFARPQINVIELK